MADKALCRAIAESRNTFDRFAAAFRNRERAQSDFMVVTLREEGDFYVPMGILVDAINGDTISGRAVENTLAEHTWGAKAGAPITCNVSNIVDWRYVDAFEMEGGLLYRELYDRQRERLQFDIGDLTPFLLLRKNDRQIDERTRRIFRDIANGRLERIQTLPVEDLKLSGIKGNMPTITFDIGRRVIVLPFTITEYAASYGDARMIDYLFQQGALEEKPGEFSPLKDGAQKGNLETTTRLLELGFDPNCKDDLSTSPLQQATMWNHLEIVRLLLKHGADPNIRDIGERTPLFYVESVEVAEVLIRAGADVNAVNDTGELCIETHIVHGQKGIVALFVKHGAKIEAPRWDAPLMDGSAAIIEYFKETGDTEGLEMYEMSSTTDYGYVLPVQTIPKSSIAGLMNP